MYVQWLLEPFGVLSISLISCLLRGMGDEFRVWYGQISHLRSLLPSKTPVVALIATATHYVKDHFIRALQMVPVKSITRSANQPNIRYSVERVSRDVHKAFGWLVSHLHQKRTALPKVIVFCHSINICASLYKMFLMELRRESYEPYGGVPSTATRLFAMYHSQVGEEEKQQIMESMLNPDGNCRILFSTTAFGMGVDVPNIRTVIHFGPPADTDDYFQECGRAGRDGKESNAILYYYPGCLIGHVSREMKLYCNLKGTCCRKELLKSFVGGVDSRTIQDLKHNCCDICTRECQCSVNCPLQHMETEEVAEVESSPAPVRVVTQALCDLLQTHLMEFRGCVLRSAHESCEGAPLYVGLDVASGLPSAVIGSIITHCEFIADSFDLEEKCLVWNYAGDTELLKIYSTDILLHSVDLYYT